MLSAARLFTVADVWQAPRANIYSTLYCWQTGFLVQGKKNGSDVGTCIHEHVKNMSFPLSWRLSWDPRKGKILPQMAI